MVWPMFFVDPIHTSPDRSKTNGCVKPQEAGETLQPKKSPMRGAEPMFAFLWADPASPLLIASNVHFLGKMSGCETSAVLGRLPTSDKFHTGRRSTQRR